MACLAAALWPLLCLAFGQADSGPKGIGRINLSGQKEGIVLTAGEGSAGLRAMPISWGPEDKRKQALDVEFPLKGTGFTKVSFTFTPESTGPVLLNLLGPYVSENGKLKRVDVIYDGLSVEGSTLVNGRFDEIRAGRPNGWMYWSKDQTMEGGPFLLPKGGVDGSAAVMCWHDGTFAQFIPVTKGKAVRLEFSARMASAEDKKSVASGEAAVETNKYRDIPDAPLSLASLANMGFADETAGDGRGGWSDQGSENDYAEFDHGRKDWQGVRFDILDPARNAGKAVLVFKSERIHRDISLDRARLDAGGAKACWLYLLHTACWAPVKGSVGTVRIHLKSGEEKVHEVQIGRDVADWWSAGHLPNAVVVQRKPNKSATVGVYLSRFAVAEEPAAVESVTLETTGGAIWIVAGTTLSCKTISFTPPRFTVKAGEQWKAVDLSKPVVAAGSALDFGGLVDAGPAGKYGRVIATPTGRLEFAQRPGREVRFTAFNIAPSWMLSPGMWCYNENPLIGADDASTRKNIEDYAQRVRRQGYNMIRLQSVELLLIDNKAAEEIAFQAAKLDLFEYLIFCLEKEGIYLNMDMAAYKVYAKGAWNEGEVRRFGERFLLDPPSRGIYERGVRMLMTHRNPYTGRTLAEDPALALITFNNEQDIPIELRMFEAEELKPLADARWQAWLKDRYKDLGTLAAEWRVNEAADWGELRFEKRLLGENTVRGNDANIFLYDLEREMLLWYQETLRKIGYPGLSAQYDVISYYRLHAVRNESPVVAMHMYHNHPSAYTDPGSRTAQNGPVQTAANYWRIASGAHFLNRPLCVTEYGAGFWGRYRHEEGLLYPAYSAFQGFSAITVHTQPVIQAAPYPLQDFMVGRDPVLRAGQVLAMLLWNRGDVSPSPHTTALTLTREYMFKNGNLNKVMSGEQGKTALLTRFGLEWPEALPKGLPPYPKADLRLVPGSGARLDISDRDAKTLDGGSATNLEGTIALMKERGILPAGNVSKASAGVFQSDTGELTLDTASESLLVITPKTEGAALKAGKRATLKAVGLIQTSTAAAIALGSLDGNALGHSKRILLVYSTDALNTGFEASDDRVTLHKQGTLPILMETGVLEVKLATPHAGAFRLEALGYDGLPVEDLSKASVAPRASASSLKTPVAGACLQAEKGNQTIRIDTALLKNGPTPFFLLTAQEK